MFMVAGCSVLSCFSLCYRISLENDSLKWLKQMTIFIFLSLVCSIRFLLLLNGGITLCVYCIATNG